MSSKLAVPVLISVFFAFSMGSYVYYSLMKENLQVAGTNIGYRFVNNQFSNREANNIFKKIYDYHSTQIKKVFPEINSSQELQNWCNNKKNKKWTSDNGTILMNGLKWCSVPTYIVLGRENSDLHEPTFGNYFKDTINPTILQSAKKLFPTIEGKGKTDSETAEIFKGVVNGFCKNVLNDAWNSYYEKQMNEIKTLCPDRAIEVR